MTLAAPTIQPLAPSVTRWQWQDYTGGGLVTGGGTQALSQVLGAALGAYAFHKAVQMKSIAGQISAAHDIAAGVFAFTPLGPFIALEGLAIGLVGGAYEKHLAKKRQKNAERRLERNIEWSKVLIQRELALGLPAAHAARKGVQFFKGGYGLTPNSVAPIAGATNRQIYFNPRTGAVDSPLGLALEYGEGEIADRVRAAHAAKVMADWAQRPEPGANALPQPFVKRRKF